MNGLLSLPSDMANFPARDAFAIGAPSRAPRPGRADIYLAFTFAT